MLRRKDVAVPACKDELIAAIAGSYGKLRADLDGVPVSLVDEASLEGHAKDTLMSVHDLVAYLTGWAELVAKWHDRKATGLDVDMPETGFKWNELGRLAQKFYADYADLPFPVLLQRFESAKDRILDIIAATDGDVLYGQPSYETYTLGRMIQFNTSSPYDNARKRLRCWKKAKGLA